MGQGGGQGAYCPPGKVLNVDGETCCLPGQYVDLSIEAASCEYCPPGTELNFEEQSCDSCQPGQFVDPSVPPSCKTCSEGKYSNTTISYSCQSCPAGRQNIDNANNPEQHDSLLDCTNCTGNTYNPYPGKNCFFCPVDTLDGADKCGDQCNVGQFKTTTINNSITTVKCSDCPVGFYSDRQNVQECTKCRQGFYSNTPSAPNCIECPKGKYGNGTDTVAPVTEELSCISCPTGRYNLNLGQDEIEDCIGCKEGTYSTEVGATSDR